jgi:hypothetical protein
VGLDGHRPELVAVAFAAKIAALHAALTSTLT